MRALAVVGLLLGCLASEASADDAELAEARRLATRAQDHFDLGEYDRAIHDFRDAYRLVPSAGFLYNLGQSYRLMGDCVSATTMYRNYLRLAPKSKYRTMVKKHLALLDACVQEQQDGQVMQAQLSGQHPGRTSKRAGIAVGGTGIALAGVGAWLAIDAGDSADAIMKRGKPGGDEDEDPPVEPPAAEDDGHLRLATALIAGGVVATAAGATLYYLGWREERRAASFSVVPMSQGAAVSVGWSW